MMFPDVPQYHTAIALIRRLNQRGFHAYLVGGCVRDGLLGRNIGDYDITTSATPQQVEEIFSKTVDTGKKFGTITVCFGEYVYEVTTFRGESTYSDGRHPDQVTLGVSLAEDLKRRDFTVNAMAFHPETGLVDPFGGEIHLKERVLVAVGTPEERFSEDSLRILRGLRFSATLGFVIENETAVAMLGCWDGLRYLPRERITMEMEKLVMGQFLWLLAGFLVVFEEGVFHSLPCLWEAEESWQLERKLEELSKAPLLKPLRLALFLSLFCPDSGLLRLSKKVAEEVDFLVNQSCLIWLSHEEFSRLICQHGREKMEHLLQYQRFHYPYHWEQLDALQNYLEQLPCTCLKELALTGYDLIEAGVTHGKMVGKLLTMALELVVSGVVENERQALLETLVGRPWET